MQYAILIILWFSSVLHVIVWRHFLMTLLTVKCEPNRQKNCFLSIPSRVNLTIVFVYNQTCFIEKQTRFFRFTFRCTQKISSVKCYSLDHMIVFLLLFCVIFSFNMRWHMPMVFWDWCPRLNLQRSVNKFSLVNKSGYFQNHHLYDCKLLDGIACVPQFHGSWNAVDFLNVRIQSIPFISDGNPIKEIQS